MPRIAEVIVSSYAGRHQGNIRIGGWRVTSGPEIPQYYGHAGRNLKDRGV
jgi:hypothetical protein